MPCDVTRRIVTTRKLLPSRLVGQPRTQYGVHTEGFLFSRAVCSFLTSSISSAPKILTFKLTTCEEIPTLDSDVERGCIWGRRGSGGAVGDKGCRTMGMNEGDGCASVGRLDRSRHLRRTMWRPLDFRIAGILEVLVAYMEFQGFFGYQLLG
ncbi:hypothetical protein OPV22_031009 [Ensete ventricosum]|uniref:Uncharacterized protein n=1 Tax=Ensete ventricosum TaxID=4639 RepID=A0AAV8PNL3_ENSVE|nr:hypothetical protein OPV22_031009 [Ensete ventricosum]